MRPLNIIVLLTSGLIAVSAANAQSPSPSDSIVRGGVGFSISDSTLSRAAGEKLREFANSVDSVMSVDKVVSVTVAGSSSPDGPEALNRRLAKERALTVRDFFAAESGIDPELFKIVVRGEDWDRFEALVNDDVNMPGRDKVLEIISSPVSLSRKEALLRAIDGGKVWSYLAANIFPKVRVAVIDVAYRNSLPSHMEVSVAAPAVPLAEEVAEVAVPGITDEEELGMIPPPRMRKSLIYSNIQLRRM